MTLPPPAEIAESVFGPEPTRSPWDSCIDPQTGEVLSEPPYPSNDTPTADGPVPLDLRAMEPTGHR